MVLYRQSFKCIKVGGNFLTFVSLLHFGTQFSLCLLSVLNSQAKQLETHRETWCNRTLIFLGNVKWSSPHYNIIVTLYILFAQMWNKIQHFLSIKATIFTYWSTLDLKQKAFSAASWTAQSILKPRIWNLLNSQAQVEVKKIVDRHSLTMEQVS